MMCVRQWNIYYAYRPSITGQIIPRPEYTRVYYGLGQFISRGIYYGLGPRPIHTPSGYNIPRAHGVNKLAFNPGIIWAWSNLSRLNLGMVWSKPEYSPWDKVSWDKQCPGCKPGLDHTLSGKNMPHIRAWFTPLIEVNVAFPTAPYLFHCYS